MIATYTDPNTPKPNFTKSIWFLLFWIFTFFILLLTLPGCQTDDQKQQYRPYYNPPSKRPGEKIRPAIHNAAVRVDDVLEKTPVPAVAEVLADDVMDTIEIIKPLPVPIAPDPRVVEIIEPKPDPLFVPPKQSEESENEPKSSIGVGFVVFISLIALIYFGLKLFKGMNKDVKNTNRS